MSPRSRFLNCCIRHIIFMAHLHSPCIFHRRAGRVWFHNISVNVTASVGVADADFCCGLQSPEDGKHNNQSFPSSKQRGPFFVSMLEIWFLFSLLLVTYNSFLLFGIVFRTTEIKPSSNKAKKIARDTHIRFSNEENINRTEHFLFSNDCIKK